MAKTKIEWCDYTINPLKGLCPMACPYCYARRMYKRFGWNPAIRFEPEELIDLSIVPDGSKVFIGSTFELFHDYVENHMGFILDCVRRTPHQTSIFLTKKPQNLIKWSPFPDNCWMGASATNTEMALEAWKHLSDIEAKVKFISFEPLQERILMKDLTVLDWLIIGAQTPYSQKTAPKIEWVKEIVDAADKAKIPVFLKDNLKPLLDPKKEYDFELRQEFPPNTLRSSRNE